MVVGAMAGLFHKLLIYWVLPKEPSPGFMRKHALSNSSAGENALLMQAVVTEHPDCIKLIGSKLK